MVSAVMWYEDVLFFKYSGSLGLKNGLENGSPQQQ